MAPVQPAQRMELLDILRGAALFGILASNMRAFDSPLAVYIDHSLMWTGTADRIAQGAIDLLITGKFITIFAFLFGVGFGIQMDRAAQRGASSAFYLRRLAVLLVFGLLHGFLLWWGDILAPYALMGFALYLFRNQSRESVALWAKILYIWPLIPMIAGAAFTASGGQIQGPARTTAAEIARIVLVYSTGTYAQIFQEHLKELSSQTFSLFFFYPRVLGIFLAGLWAWRTGLLLNLSEKKPLLRRLGRWGFSIGLAGNAVTVAIQAIWHPDPFRMEPLGAAQNLVGSVAVPAMSLGYASALALLYLDSSHWRVRLRPFGAVGRTALTNYLAQSAICTTIYNSWGFALFGSVGPLAGLIPTVALYAAQVAASVAWVRRFAFGPAEWLWRVLTYGRIRDRIVAGGRAVTS